RAVFQRMRGKAAKGAVPTEIRVLVVRLRRDIGPRGPREPLYRMMGLQAGPAPPALGKAPKGDPNPTPPDHSTHGSLPFPSASRSCHSYLIAATVPGGNGRGSTSTTPWAMRTR